MITVTGSLAFDHIMDFKGKFADHIMPDQIHQINLSFLVNNLKKQKGGTAGNIAYNLALLKTPCSILGSAGSDFAEYGEFLKSHGVDTSQIKIIQNKFTSSAFIMTDLSDNQITGFYPGAMSENVQLSLSSPSRSQSPPGRWPPDFVVIAPNDPKAMVKFAKECRQFNIPYMLDPGMQLPALNPEDLKTMIEGAAILIGNDYEMELLMSKLKCQVSNLLENAEIIITTLGEKGSTIQSGSETFQIEAGKITEVVDPTGAGDAYRAGFLAGYMKGLSLKTAGQMGATTACYAIEEYGTTSHSFTTQEFCDRYKQNFNEELKL